MVFVLVNITAISANEINENQSIGYDHPIDLSNVDEISYSESNIDLSENPIDSIFNNDSQSIYSNENFNEVISDSNDESSSNNEINSVGTVSNYLSNSDEVNKVSDDVSSYGVNNKSNASFIITNFTTERLSGQNFTATLVDSKGNPLAGYEITLTLFNNLGESKAYWRTTNVSGVAKLVINLAQPSVYQIVANFTGNDIFNPVESQAINLTITRPNSNATLITGSGSPIIRGDTFNITLTDINGNPIANQNISINLSINGLYKIYYNLTDEHGVAHMLINLAPLNWTLTYSFPGNSQYLKSENHTDLEVLNSKIDTNLNGNDATFIHGTSGNYSVTLTDSNGNPLSNQLIAMNLSVSSYSKVYNVYTDANGVATLPINLINGTFSIAYSFAGTTKYSPSKGLSTITVVEPKNDNTNAVWVFGKDMYNVNLNTLADYGYGNIFLNFYAFSLYSQSSIEAWIAQCNNLGLSVHIWMQCFYDGGWINPVDSSTGKLDQNLLNTKLQEAIKYANVKGVAGIHLDYLRYPGNAYSHTGGTQAINDFVKEITTAIRNINSNLILSASVMPETTSNIYYYGQDITTLSTYLDVIVPMVYKGNYKEGSTWITNTVKWFKDNTVNAEIWAGLQSYVSDDDTTKLSAAQLTTDCNAALKGGADGLVFFRYGLLNFINLNNL